MRVTSKDQLVRGVRRRLRKLRARVRARLGTGPGDAAVGKPRPKRIAAIVERFDNRSVLGWVAAAKDGPPVRVSLHVNALEVAATWATDPMPRNNWGEIRSFEFALYDLWNYTKRRDKVTVRVNDRSLPISGHGLYLLPAKNGRSDLATLTAKFDSGHVFGQTGRLQLSKKLDTEWQRQVMELYTTVRTALAEVAGYDAFFIYGTLLGAVRENGVIGHDLDFDAAFISRHRDGFEAAQELADIARELIDRGFDVRCERSALHLYSEQDPSLRIDLFHLYFDDEGRIQFPFGIAGTSEFTESDWQGTSEIDFLGGRGLCPIHAEALVEHLYGAGWRSPKPGFDWKRDRTTRAWDGVLPLELTSSVDWTNYYAHHRKDGESTFATAVIAALSGGHVVLDLGSGDGADALAFAAAGHRVVGVERCSVGVRNATARATEAHQDSAAFRVGDLTEAETLRTAAADARADDPKRPLVFYLRFLLHAVPPEVHDVLMTTIGEIARPGDVFAAEFRTLADKTLPKAQKRKYRRFLDADAFAIELDALGFTVLQEERGTALAVFGDEDPEVCRVVARRT